MKSLSIIIKVGEIQSDSIDRVQTDDSLTDGIDGHRHRRLCFFISVAPYSLSKRSLILERFIQAHHGSYSLIQGTEIHEFETMKDVHEFIYETASLYQALHRLFYNCGGRWVSISILLIRKLRHRSVGS